MVVWLIDSLLLDQIAGVRLLFAVQIRFLPLHPFKTSVGHPAVRPVRVAVAGSVVLIVSPDVPGSRAIVEQIEERTAAQGDL